MIENQNNIVLKTEGLSIGYTSKKSQLIIQKDINLSIKKGQLVAILGKNGIGKSTLLKTLTRVQNPLSGDIYLNEKKLSSFDVKSFAKKVGIVLTESLPESQLTVFELVALGRQPYTNWVGKLQQEDIDKVLWALEITDTSDLSEKYFYELSDGQLQRVLIARALTQDTELIFLDEPTAHLDMHHTIKIFQLLKKLVNETQKTIIITSHQVNLAIQTASQLVLLTEEELFYGSKEQLISKNIFSKLFPSEIVQFDSNLEQFILRKKS